MLVCVGDPNVWVADQHWGALLRFAIAGGGYTGCAYRPTTASTAVDRLEEAFGSLSLAPGDRSWPGLPRAFRDSVTGADVALDLSAAQTWLDYGLLPSWAAGDARLPALQNILLRARMYRQLLQPNASIAYPPTAVVTSVKGEMTGGSGNYTVDVVRRSIDWTPTGASPTGDGSVCTQCAMPPYPVPPSRVFFASTGTSHRLMMQDMVAIKAAMDSVGPYPSAPIPATFAA